MKMIGGIVAAAFAISFSGAMSLRAGELLLHYPLNEGSGLVAKDEGPSRLDLEIGAGMGWSLKGDGPGGGSALGRVGDGDVYGKNLQVDGKIPELVSYTVTGWYKLGEMDKGTGALVDMPSSGGNGLQVHFSYRAEGDTRKPEQALVIVVGPEGTNPYTGRGVRYSLWDAPYGKTGEWVFFAISVDTFAESQQIRFYAGTESEPAAPLGGRFTFSEEEDPESFKLGKVDEIWVANNGASPKPRPIDVGTYLSHFRFYGSPDDGSGALSASEIEGVRQEAISR